jgi:hypothetical protein
MSVSKNILTGVIALAGLASSAVAQVTIYVAGANGDRATTNTAINKLLTGTKTYAGINNDLTRSNQSTFTGTFGTTQVTVKTSYIGATGGIGAVAGNTPVRFLPDGATGGSNPDPTIGNNPNDAAIPQIAMSTNFVSSSPYTPGTAFEGGVYPTLVDELVSVVGMKWIGSKGLPIDNITPQQAQVLFLSGRLPLAFFTGNPADENKSVFATGRNLDAGQRFAAQAEAGIGIFSQVKQYKPNITGAAAGVGGFVTGGTVDSHVLWPVETFSGVSSEVPGNSGATTGANLAPILTATLGTNAYKVGNPNATAGYYISYLTPQDADTISIPNGAVELKWNGVPFSEDNIRSGRYTFWVYEHIMRRQELSGIALDFFVALRDQIKNVDATVAGIKLDTVRVGRLAEGGLVTPNY